MVVLRHDVRMERVEVELFDRVGNVAVVRLPEPRSPGILIQGDSLAIIAGDARRLADAVRGGGDVQESADELALQFAELLAYYASSLDAHGVPLPYAPES